ncbi:MAG: RNA polymerase subunit sigma [Opitutae bacterium]|nr:RNA polymerase subunit sigma [Opitutae bacterium]
MIQEEGNALKTYLDRIAKVNLLTREQEGELAARIAAGDEKAREHMITANLRLVVKIAQDYSNLGLHLLDLISEGNIGLMKAVERFDPNKGGKLSTYASWWIKQSIKRALANQSKTIRLPVHMIEKVARMNKISLEMNEKLGREPTNEELAEEVEMAVSKVAHLKNVSARPSSLEAPIGGDNETTLGDIVGDDNSQSPLERLQSKSLVSDVNSVLDKLDSREAEIIRLRFGLKGEEPQTLEEVGVRFKVTRERVRQLQDIAIRKMRKAMASLEHPREIDEMREEERLLETMRAINQMLGEKPDCKDKKKKNGNSGKS